MAGVSRHGVRCMACEADPNQVVAGRYRVLRALGAGAHGTVDLAEDLLHGGRRVALKRLEGIVGAGDPEPAAEILRWFLHPRWAEVLDEGRLDAHGRFQVLRYVPGSGLDKAPLPLPVDDVLRFLEDGARVLRALHAHGILHYDVTPGNFVVEDGPQGRTFTLTDGGLANVGPVRGVARGTPAFMAPEVLEGGAHDHRADLYSLGLIAFRLATGRDPVQGGAGEVLGRRRREDAPLLRTFRADLPEGLERVVAALLARDPARRPSTAGELLDLLAANGRPEAGRPSVDESIAFATGGPLVGRKEVLDRFEQACHGISGTASPGNSRDGAFVPDGPTDVPDLVLVLHGPPGSGGTRLARQLAACARQNGLPVLALSGREGAADRRSPLRRLAEAIAHLAPHGDAYLATAPQSRGERATGDDTDARSIERFVELCERVATQTPLVVVIEDFAELPRTAQEGVRVLARHLQTRVEHPDGRRVPRLALVVDHGPQDPHDLLIPDAKDPRRPCVPIGPFDDEAIAALLASRLVGCGLDADGAQRPETAYRPEARDLEHLRRATEGLPRMLASAIAEGLTRGDLRCDLSHWLWDTDRVPEYPLARALAPDVARALETAAPEVRSAAIRLALFDSPISEALLRELAGDGPTTALLRTPLTSAAVEGEHVRVAPSSLSVRGALRALPRATLDAERAAVLAVLARRTSPDLTPDHARMLLDAGDEQGAFRRLTDGVAPTRAALTRSLGILGEVLAARPEILRDPAARLAAARRLVPQAEAAAASDALHAALPRDLGATDLEVTAILAGHDYTLRRYERVLSLAARVPTSDPGPTHAVALAQLRVAQARAALASGARDASRLVRSAAVALRALPRPDRARSLALRTEYDLASARLRALQKQRNQVTLNRRALRRARAARDLGLVASAYTNLAVALHAEGDVSAAEQATARAVKIKYGLGDLHGVVGSLHNLAKLKEQQGRVREATTHYQRVVALGSRYAHREGTALALTRLASIYEAERNPRLALNALRRAQDLSRGTGTAYTFALSARSASQIYDLRGDHTLARKLLSHSTRALRVVDPSRAWLVHQEAAAARDLLLGQHAKAVARLTRIERRSPEALRPLLVHTAAAISRASGASTTSLPQTLLSRAAGLPKSTPLRGTIAAALRATRTACRSSSAGTNALLQSLPPTTTGSALETRLLAEVMLVAVQRSNSTPKAAHQVVELLCQFAQEQEFTTLRARALAVRALLSLRDGAVTAACQQYSAALGVLTVCSEELAAGAQSAAVVPPPPEFGRAALAIARRTLKQTAAVMSLPLSWTALHALAHRFNLHSGASEKSDPRLQTALRTILSMSARLKTRASLDSLLESLNHFAREITKAEHTCVVLLGPEGSGEIQVATSSSDKADSPISRASHTVLRRVLKAKTPLLLHDVFGDSELMERPSITAMALRSVICVPLLRGDQVYGAMYADSSAGAGSFDKVDLEILSLFAEQAAAAIETSRLLVDVQRSYAELKAAQERLIRGERLRVMGEMTSGVAHEFNNLLTAILARIQLLGLEDLPSGVRESLALMEKAAMDAAGVVRRLQSFTRAQRQADFHVVDMADVCADVVEFLRPLWATRRQSGRPAQIVRLRTVAGLFVRGDPTELREVVTNLLKNALDALDRGGTIVVTGERQGGRVRIELRDDGPGIPVDLQSKLFTPFFTTKGERGTGLGLCLSQQIVERHSGELRITSAPGEGTTAVVELPASGPKATEPHEAASPSPQAPVRVLVVDDDPHVLVPLCTFLRRSGQQVRSAESASAALAALAQERPDVVISDISMPGMDGLELCRRLRRDYTEIPVILMTGQTSNIDPAQANLSGATALLAKPFTMRQVLDLLASTARRSRT